MRFISLVVLEGLFPAVINLAYRCSILWDVAKKKNYVRNMVKCAVFERTCNELVWKKVHYLKNR